MPPCRRSSAAIAELDADPGVEVIVVARGGGAVEDLLPFSNEMLVRAAAACRTPLVSAIGHETDTPLLDLVADYRASTPTDAAKRIVPDVTEERDAPRPGPAAGCGARSPSGSRASRPALDAAPLATRARGPRRPSSTRAPPRCRPGGTPPGAPLDGALTRAAGQT